MTPQSAPHPTPAAYTERLGVPLWTWPVALLVDLIIGFELLLVFGGPGWLPFAVLVPLTVFGIVRAGRIRITVAGGEFRVDDARLPVAVIADVVALDAAGKREALGVGTHPLAFIIQRPWLGPAVQVLLDDPEDPTPFWVISTRQPVELATVLLAARDEARAAGSAEQARTS